MELGCIQCILQEQTLLTAPRKHAHSKQSVALIVWYWSHAFSHMLRERHAWGRCRCVAWLPVEPSRSLSKLRACINTLYSHQS